MNESNAWTNVSVGLLPPAFARGSVGSAQFGAVLDEQRRAENVAFCRTTVAVYALFRDRYGERESAFLSSEVVGREVFARRRELSLAYESVKAELSVALRLGPAATDTAIDQAVGFLERLPRVFALVGRNVISPRAGQEALSRSRALNSAQVLEFDEALAAFLERDALSVTALPALREAADRIVHQIDPVAAERRRKQAEEDRTFSVRPADDGMAAAYALLTVHEGRELAVLVDETAATVCARDPRTAEQRAADALVMRVRGFVTLGCQCADEACASRSARQFTDGGVDDDGARVLVKYRTLIQVVVNEKTLVDEANTDAAFVVDHGPVTASQARELATRADAVIRPFGTEVDTAAQKADASAEHACAAGDVVVPSPSRPWFRSVGVDVAWGAPRGVLLAARCRRSVDGQVAERAQPPASVAPQPLVIATAGSGYRFSADLSRYFSLLFPRCVFPLCTRASSRCQLDHRREYDHTDPARGGLSTADNGQPLCLPHHALKTTGLWTDAPLPDGRILWIGPAGQRAIVDPSATILAMFPDLRRIRWTTAPAASTRTGAAERSGPGKQSGAGERSEAGGEAPPSAPSGPTRLQREHARRERLRAAHIEALRREREPAPTSQCEQALAAVLDGRDPRRVPPPPDEPPPY